MTEVLASPSSSWSDVPGPLHLHCRLFVSLGPLQQETFFNGVWRKAKSFARPTSASNMGSRRPSIAVNSNTSTGMGSQASAKVRNFRSLPHPQR